MAVHSETPCSHLKRSSESSCTERGTTRPGEAKRNEDRARARASFTRLPSNASLSDFSLPSMYNEVKRRKNFYPIIDSVCEEIPYRIFLYFTNVSSESRIIVIISLGSKI